MLTSESVITETLEYGTTGLGTEVSSQTKVSRPVVRPAHSTQIASFLVILADIFILFGTGLTILFQEVGWGGEAFWVYLPVLIVASAVIVAGFYENELYTFDSICSPTTKIPKILKVITLSFLSFLALAFAFKVSDQVSRAWVFSWYGAGIFLILLERSLCRFLFVKWAHSGKFSREVVLVGCGDQTKKLLEQFQSTKEPWVRIIGVFDDRKDRVGPTFMGHPVLGGLDDLITYSRTHRVDDIIINLPWNADSRIIEIVRKLDELPIHVRLGSDLAGFVRSRTSYSAMGGVPMLDVVHKPLEGWGYFLKNLEDKVLAFLLLLLASPVMLFIAAAIKLESKGPVFFMQERHGFNNKTFRVFKFRSMYHNGDASKNRFSQAVQNDSRVTRVGAFIRRTSLDELPQLINVVLGTMSLVGPRPHPIELNEEFCDDIDRFFARHRVKPGITGWAQVNGLRGETDTLEKMKARIEHDNYYTENWSILFDLRILVMTLFVLASQKNAY